MSNRLQQNYTKVQMKQIRPGVGVFFKWETPTPGLNPDSGGLRLPTPTTPTPHSWLSGHETLVRSSSSTNFIAAQVLKQNFRAATGTGIVSWTKACLGHSSFAAANSRVSSFIASFIAFG